MKSTANQTIRNAVVAETIVNGIRRMLWNLQGTQNVGREDERDLLAYAKKQQWVEEGEILVCRTVYGNF